MTGGVLRSQQPAGTFAAAGGCALAPGAQPCGDGRTRLLPRGHGPRFSQRGVFPQWPTGPPGRPGPGHAGALASDRPEGPATLGNLSVIAGLPVCLSRHERARACTFLRRYAAQQWGEVCPVLPAPPVRERAAFCLQHHRWYLRDPPLCARSQMPPDSLFVKVTYTKHSLTAFFNYKRSCVLTFCHHQRGLCFYQVPRWSFLFFFLPFSA